MQQMHAWGAPGHGGIPAPFPGALVPAPVSPRSAMGYGGVPGVLAPAPVLVPAVSSGSGVIVAQQHSTYVMQAVGSVQAQQAAPHNGVAKVAAVGSPHMVQPAAPLVKRLVSDSTGSLSTTCASAARASAPSSNLSEGMSVEIAPIKRGSSVERVSSATRVPDKTLSGNPLPLGHNLSEIRTEESSGVLLSHRSRGGDDALISPRYRDGAPVAARPPSRSSSAAATTRMSPRGELAVSGVARQRSNSPTKRELHEIAHRRCKLLFEESKARQSRKNEREALSPLRERRSPSPPRIRGFDFGVDSRTFAERTASDLQWRMMRHSQLQTMQECTFQPATTQWRAGEGKNPQYRPKLPKARGFS